MPPGLCLVLLSVLLPALTLAHQQESGLTNAERQLILDEHNRMRASIAKGGQGGHPQAANMMALVSDLNSADEFDVQPGGRGVETEFHFLQLVSFILLDDVFRVISEMSEISE